METSDVYCWAGHLEARVESIGAAPSHPIASPVASEIPRSLTSAIADLERRVTENTRELALLRKHIDQAERRAAIANSAEGVTQTRISRYGGTWRCLARGRDQAI